MSCQGGDVALYSTTDAMAASARRGDWTTQALALVRHPAFFNVVVTGQGRKHHSLDFVELNGIHTRQYTLMATNDSLFATWG